jgi:hypothetical protein
VSVTAKWGGFAFLAVLAAAGAIAFSATRTDPAGELADDIANALDCTGPEAVSEDSDRSRDGEVSVFTITCAEGYVNPFATLYRFERQADLRRGLDSGLVKENFVCVVDDQVFTNSFYPFEEFCREHGGKLVGERVE